MAHRLQRQRGAGEQPHRVAGAARADREAGEDEVLLGAVEDRVQPRAELGERARVARELAVDAVEREREPGAGSRPPRARALAGRERRGGEQPDGERDQRHLVGREPAAGRPAGDVLRVGRDEERREEAVGALDRRVEQRLVLVVLLDLLGGAVERRRRQRARPEQRAQLRGADVGPRAHEADEQQRGDVVGGDRAPPLELGGVLRRELGGVEHLARRRGIARHAVAGEQREHPPPVPGLAGELLLPVRRRARVDERGEPLRDLGDAGAVGGRDLEHAEERAGRVAHGVVGRAGRDDAPAARARAERERARDRAAGAEDAGGDAGVDEQAGEHLALGDEVGVGDHERPVVGGGQAGDRPQVVGRAPARVHLHGRGRDGGGPVGPGEHVDALDAQARELLDQPARGRRALPRLERGGAAAVGRRGRDEHRGRAGRDRRSAEPADGSALGLGLGGGAAHGASGYPRAAGRELGEQRLPLARRSPRGRSVAPSRAPPRRARAGAPRPRPARRARARARRRRRRARARRRGRRR